MSAALTMQPDSFGEGLNVADTYDLALSPTPDTRQRPLWLTENEAETLMAFCVSSLCSGGEGDLSLFHKLGEYIHSFRRQQVG